MPHSSLGNALRGVPAEGPCPGDLARMAGVFTSLVVCVVGGVLGGRRFAGALTVPLDASLLAVVAAGAALTAAFSRFAWISGSGERPGTVIDRAVLAAPTVGIVLLGYGLALPDDRIWVKALLWTFLIVEEASSGWWAFRRSRALRPGRLRVGKTTSVGGTATNLRFLQS